MTIDPNTRPPRENRALTGSFRTVEECRAEAAECRYRAMVAADRKRRIHYFSLAKLWDVTAAELESRAT